MKVWNGGGSAAAIASLTPVTSGAVRLQSNPPPRPIAAARIEPAREDARASRIAAQNEARAIANAYRDARLAEYQLRRARMEELRQALR